MSLLSGPVEGSLQEVKLPKEQERTNRTGRMDLNFIEVWVWFLGIIYFQTRSSEIRLKVKPESKN